ncbi:unnamed protein product [Parajaminaea phylloscopi]
MSPLANEAGLRSHILFEHHAARVVQSIPPTKAPVRKNGNTPRDFHGLGHLGREHDATAGTVLQDWTGNLQLFARPRYGAAGGNLVFELQGMHFSIQGCDGTPRVCSLPFRSYGLDGTMPASTVPRLTYAGGGAGVHGIDGGSFWFFEDISESGAAERFEKERNGTGRRAIWTIWLFSTSAPVVDNLRAILASFPVMPSPLPGWISGRDGKPWRDRLLQHVPEIATQGNGIGADCTGAPRIGVATSSILTAPAEFLCRPAEQTNKPGSALCAASSVDPLLTTVASASELGVASIARENDATLNASTSRTLRRSGVDSLRHSLVAVDSETGVIVGILGRDVYLAEGSPIQDGKPNSSAAPPVLRSASVYRDEDAHRPASRQPSILRDDTFAPPPLPEKDFDCARDSMASVAFYSAQEDLWPTESEAEVEVGQSPRQLSQRVSIDHFHRGVEAHRDDLMRDPSKASASDDCDSDASGSTIGGPVDRLWNRAKRGKKRQQKAQKVTQQPKSDTPAPLDAIGDEEHSSGGQHANGRCHNIGQKEPPPSGVRSIGQAAMVGRDEPLLQVQSDTSPLLLSPMTACKALHGHGPRALMATEDVVLAEEQVWQEAFQQDHLPADGAYTHLLAISSEAPSASSVVQKAHGNATSVGESPDGLCDSLSPDKTQYMQGGTVLLRFLSGTARIGASILLPDSHAMAPSERGDGVKERAWSTTANVLSLLPALPAHFLGIWQGVAASEHHDAASQTPVSQVATTLASGVSTALEALTSWSETALKAPTALLEWFAMPNPPGQQVSSCVADDAWELAIPAFDPNSLASTPRPVYRRKRLAPSADQGFHVCQSLTKRAGPDEANISDVSPNERPVASSDGSRPSTNRYSIIHFDGEGVGRRAFFRQQDVGYGLPASSGLSRVIGVL